MWPWLNDNSDAVQATTSIALALLAVIAAFVARAQVMEARKLRRAQAQPYVAAGMRQSLASAMVVEIFFRNYGATAAHNVQVTCDPPLTAKWGADPVELVPLFSVLPTMVPGEEWATLWDNGMTRWESNQAMSSTAVISWEDSAGQSFSGRYILDWEAHKGRQFLAQKGMDDLAKAVIKLGDAAGRAVQGNALIIQRKEERDAELEARRAGLAERQAQRQISPGESA